MKHLKRNLLAVLAMALFAFSGMSQEVVLNDNLQSALTGQPDNEIEVYLLLTEQLDKDAMQQMKAERGPASRKALVPAMIPALQSIAKNSQADLVNFLLSNGVEQNSIRSYWIENIVYARVPESLIPMLSSRKDLLEIGLRTEIQWIESLEEKDNANSNSLSSVLSEGGLQRINAPFMWRKGYSGYGTKIFIIDSGVDPFHEALDRQNAWHNRDIDEVWIGTEGEPFTYDCESHGTHVIGTSVGLAREKQDTIGVAFNSEWMAGNPIGCNIGFPQNTILEMFQWSLNPDRNVNTTDDVPDVINNSWGDFSLGFCSNVYRNSLEVLENAGIAVIFSAGNEGPGDRTVSPPGNLEINPVNPMTVGALTTSNNIADFSSRGPSRCFINGSRPIKPEVSAPGVNVRSSLPGDRYREQQGTSMASPHVAGACLLLMEAFPNLTARVIKEALYFSARDLGDPGEDNDYGRGIIDLERAYNYLVSRGNTPVSINVNQDVELWNAALNQYGCDTDFSADVQLYNAGTSPVTSVEVELHLEGTNRRSSSTWTGTLFPGETTWFSLDPLDATSGEYDAVLQITNVNGNGKDQRGLNDQMKRKVDLRTGNNYAVNLQEAFGDLCSGSRALVTVNGAEDADRYSWYSVFPFDSPVGSTRSFTPELEPGENQFYVQPEYDDQVGMEAPVESSLNFGYSGGRLQFDALQPFRLRSLDIFSSDFGPIGFLIRRDRDTVFQTAGYFATGGLQTLPINRLIPAGRDYEIILYNNP
ncbi:MAG TPA: S8 family serine peptidase, partial [Saprospiraceae bacterium]|nr:S8 family serine peptidase [Saprospiraceae bacterium]